MMRNIISAPAPSPTPAPGEAGGGAPAAAAAAPAEQPAGDDYTAKLVKLIPSETLAAYIALDGILRTAKDQVPVSKVFWVVFAILLVGTPLYLAKIAKVARKLQIAASTISFVVWVAATGGVVKDVLPWVQPVYGTMAMILWTFFVPIFFGGQAAAADKGG